jgi:hypothetical protein
MSDVALSRDNNVGVIVNTCNLSSLYTSFVVSEMNLSWAILTGDWRNRDGMKRRNCVDLCSEPAVRVVSLHLSCITLPSLSIELVSARASLSARDGLAMFRMQDNMTAPRSRELGWLVKIYYEPFCDGRRDVKSPIYGEDCPSHAINMRYIPLKCSG